MDFIQYKNTIENFLKKYRIDKVDLEPMFEAYVNGTTAKDYIRKYCNTMNECSNQEKLFNKYLNKVLSIVKKSGYNIIRVPHELNEDIEYFYNDGYGAAECASYISEKLVKNTVKVKNKDNKGKAVLFNKLLLLVHGIDDVALKDVKVEKDSAYAILRIKLFNFRNELNTDVKGYLTGIDKQFRPFVKQNVDNAERITIIGYSLTQKSVFCTVQIKIDLLDEKSKEFSINETANIIKMYTEIFKTFGEQFRVLI